jgi:pilin isopeptide linkage protein
VDCYWGYYLKFLHTIEASKSKPITVKYYAKFNTTAKNAGAGNMWCGNYIDMRYKVNNKWVYASGSEAGSYVWGGDVESNVPLTKTNGTYHEDDGTVTWDINVNQRDSVGGNATLIDLLPAGLTFVSAEITGMGDAASKIGTTVNGKTLHETITAEDVEVDENYTENNTKYTKVTFSVENLSRYQKVENDTLVENTGHTTNGRVVVTITAKVDPGILASLDSNKTVTNKAILTGNDYLPEGGVSATCNATIPATGSSVVSKSMATQEAPAYVQFALDINSKALDLVADDGSLTIDDVMGTGMTMATSHENCFQVYDVTDVENLYKSDGTVDATQAATGENITEACSWEATETAGTYQITVPDKTHVVIVYWAAFSGVDGQKVQLSNNAYFHYGSENYSNNSSRWSSKLQVSTAGGSGFTNPYFYLQKLDQWGNNVSGAEFDLYQYNPDGDDTYITTVTTENGKAYVGHRSETSFSNLKPNTIYVLQEASAPAGYIKDPEKYYFEFAQITGSGDDGEVTADDITNHEQSHKGLAVVDMSPGGTYTLTNRFKGASLTVPVVKTINNKNLSSTTEFSFTLTPKKGDPTVYTDEDYKQAVSSDTGTTITITGSGSEAFEIYFKTIGNYTFTVTENDLSKEAIARGYTEKDSTTYTLNVTVGEKEGAVVVTDATFTPAGNTTGNLLNGAVLTFNNKLELSGKLNLQVKKTVSGRTEGVKADEFSFNVLKNGQAITGDDGNPLVFKTQEGGLVDIEVPLTQDDIGTQDFVIKEVVPTGSAADPSISYEAVSVIATVTISEIPATDTAVAKVAATSDVAYTAGQTDKNGVPLMVNKYSATGKLSLTGTKELRLKSAEGSLVTLRNNEFSFEVYEGHTRVATGTNDKNGKITFSDIVYTTSDVGKHTYTVKEVTGNDLFVVYTDVVHTVNVTVTDEGSGVLKATVTAVDGDVIEGNEAQRAKLVENSIDFTNIYTLVMTGIRLDVLPYVLILALALGCGALVLRRRKHMRG